MRIRGRKFGQVAVYGAVAGSTPFSITPQTPPAGQNGAATSFTFTAAPLGTAGATRIIAVAIAHGINAVTISSVTVGGNAATQATSAAATASDNSSRSDIWYYADAGALGTSADIVVNLSGSQSRCAIATFTVVGTGAAFSVANNAGTAGSQTSISDTATVPAGGGALVILSVHNTTLVGFTPTNWTSDSGVTAYGSNLFVSGHTTSASGSTAFSASWTSPLNGSISVAAFSP